MLSGNCTEALSIQANGSKLQTPNSKEAPTPKLQGSEAARGFGICSLGILWSLVFGIWCFDPLPVRGVEDVGLPCGFRLPGIGVEGLPVWLVLGVTPSPHRGGVRV